MTIWCGVCQNRMAFFVLPCLTQHDIHVFLISITILMGICQIVLLQILSNIHNTLHEKNLVFKRSLIWLNLRLAQPVRAAFDSTDHWGE